MHDEDAEGGLRGEDGGLVLGAGGELGGDVLFKLGDGVSGREEVSWGSLGKEGNEEAGGWEERRMTKSKGRHGGLVD